jgi:cephalosporin-C deacetylase
MKKNIAAVFLAAIIVQSVSYAQTGELILKQSAGSGIYKKGQKISVFAFPRNGSDSVRVSVMKNNNIVILKKAIKAQGDSVLVFESSFTEPCSIIVDVKAGSSSASIGSMVDPYHLKPGASMPDDFKAYWAKEKKALGDLQLEVKSVPVASVADGFSCSDMEINCTGPKPVRGYYAKPEKAAPHSLPAVLLVHAAGVKGSWCRSEPGNAMNYAKKGAICFDLNAHGMLDGQPESYYADLENGELKNYFMKGVTSREDFYFRGMYLRLLRTIDFLARQPEWDGKRILVTGESQGGGQALAAAGLDSRVSAVVAIVPAMCDFMGALAGRRGGWPQPFENNNAKEEMKSVLPYFDDAMILKGSRAQIFCEVGLIDLTCPPASVIAAVNQSKGKKMIYAVPFRGHQTGPFTTAKNKLWQDQFYKPREEFINNYLK